MDVGVHSPRDIGHTKATLFTRGRGFQPFPPLQTPSNCLPSLHPSNFPLIIYAMSSFDLTSWLAGAGLERLEGALRSNEVLSADDLFGLSEADIRELAPVMGVRNRFMRAIAALRDVEGAGGVSAPQGVSTGKTIVFSKAPPTPARTPGTPRTPTAKRGARRTSRPAERSVYTAEPRQLVLRRTVSPGPTGLGVGGGGGGGVGVSGRASFGVDNSYIAERRRREAERTELRKQTLVQERERWLQLLQYGVYPPLLFKNAVTLRCPERISVNIF